MLAQRHEREYPAALVITVKYSGPDARGTGVMMGPKPCHAGCDAMQHVQAIALAPVAFTAGDR